MILKKTTFIMSSLLLIQGTHAMKTATEKGDVSRMETVQTLFLQAEALIQKGDFNGASALYFKVIHHSKDRKSHAQAQFALGILTYFGLGVPQDYQTAYVHFNHAAQNTMSQSGKQALTILETNKQCYLQSVAEELLTINEDFEQISGFRAALEKEKQKAASEQQNAGKQIAEIGNYYLQAMKQTNNPKEQAQAWLVLGLLSYLGRGGICRDYQSALGYFERASKQDHQPMVKSCAQKALDILESNESRLQSSYKIYNEIGESLMNIEGLDKLAPLAEIKSSL